MSGSSIRVTMKAILLGVLALSTGAAASPSVTNAPTAQTLVADAAVDVVEGAVEGVVKVNGATHHGVLNGEFIQWESDFYVQSNDGKPIVIALTTPLSEGVTAEGARISRSRRQLFVDESAIWADPRNRRGRRCVVKIQQAAPRHGETMRLEVPLAGAPIERITSNRFTLEPTADYGVRTRVGKRVAHGVNTKERHRFERVTRGVAPAGALYLAPSPVLRDNGLVARFSDDEKRRQHTARYFGFAGIALVFGLGVTVFGLRKLAAREKATVVLETDIDDLVRMV